MDNNVLINKKKIIIPDPSNFLIENSSLEDFKIKNLSKTNAIVSPLFFGTNLEHTRSDVYDGIAAQMLRNRKFAGLPEAAQGISREWFIVGKNTYCAHSEPYTKHSDNGYHMKRRFECRGQTVFGYDQTEDAGIGQHGLYITGQKELEFRIVIRTNDTLSLRVALTSRSGDKTFDLKTITISGYEWKTYSLYLTPNATDEDADLRISFANPGKIEIGAVSLMPSDNFLGMRKDVIQNLKKLGVSLLRWPGGNFAGEYCWFDGLLPVDMRAPCESALGLETQPHSVVYDNQELGIDEFMMLCRELGAEPYITINSAWLSPEENAMFVEYCNGDKKTEYGKTRISRGFKEPFNVKLWSLGNEAGYGHMEGDNTPEGYRRVAVENAKAMWKVDPTLRYCSSGPTDEKWMEVANNPIADISTLKSVHYYSPEPVFENGDGMEKQFYVFLNAVEEGRRQIRVTRNVLDERIALSLDEWNSWYAWYRPGSAAEGIQTALLFHMIIQETIESKIDLVCHFEAVNEGTLRVNKNGTSFLTAAGQAISIMNGHKNNSICSSQRFVLLTENNNEYYLTVTNPYYDKTIDFECPLSGKEIKGKLLTSDSVMPHKLFEEKDISYIKNGGKNYFVIPPHSVLSVKIIK